jgi:hypothetical protein
VGALDCRGRGDRTLVWNDTVMAENFFEINYFQNPAVRRKSALARPCRTTTDGPRRTDLQDQYDYPWFHYAGR